MSEPVRRESKKKKKKREEKKRRRCRPLARRLGIGSAQVSRVASQVEKKSNPDGSTTEITTIKKSLPDGSVETTTKTRTYGVPVNDVQAELKQGELVDKQVDTVKNPDGTTTETTVFTVREGNVTKKITETKTF